MNKIVLITGVTGAIGGATALEVARTGATVVLFGRNRKRVENLKKGIVRMSGSNNIDILIADLSDLASVKKAANEFKLKYNRLDVLLNIAAVYKNKRVVTKDNLELMFATNHLGPFVLTNELLDVLKSGKTARIITLTAPSTTEIKFDDLQGEKKFSSLKAFGASKTMNLLFTYALARRLTGTGVSATAFLPGITRSNMIRERPPFIKFFLRLIAAKPERAAAMLRHIAIDQKYQNANGKFYKFNGKEIRSSSYSHNIDNQEHLWKRSELLVKQLIKEEELIEVY
ncbi:MAG: SDR family NAD(P)-dependent oxidoreductase [Bacteroidota bacterium]